MLEKTNKYKVILDNPWYSIGDIVEDKSFGETYRNFPLFLERLYVLSDGSLVGESEEVYVLTIGMPKGILKNVKDVYTPLWDSDGKFVNYRYCKVVIYKDEQHYLDSQKVKNDIIDNIFNSQPKPLKEVHLENNDVGIIIYE